MWCPKWNWQCGKRCRYFFSDVVTGAVAGLILSGGQSDGPAKQYYTPGGTPSVNRRRVSPVPSELDDEVADHENDALNERWEQESQIPQKTESSRRSLREHLDEVTQPQNVSLPLAGSLALSNYGSVASSSSPAPTHYHIDDSPTPGRGSAQSIHSSPQGKGSAQSIHSSPQGKGSAQSVHSSPQVIHSSPEEIQSSPESSFARTEGENRSQQILNQRMRRQIDFA